MTRKDIVSISLGASIILLAPLFVFAHAEDADIVPHADVLEVSEMSEMTKTLIQEALTEEVLIQEVSEMPTEEVLAEEVQVIQVQEDEHFVGDGHTDHGHAAPVSTIPWWQSQIWWISFISSLVLMSLFSFGVYKYLKK